MKKSISVNKNPVGRPKKKGGPHPVSAVRLPPEVAEAVDAWAARQADAPARSEAIRRLVEIGLSKSELPKRPNVLSTAKQSAARAVELAGNAIDKHSDENASDDERSTRKRKLIQGPSVYRDARKDRPGK